MSAAVIAITMPEAAARADDEEAQRLADRSDPHYAVEIPGASIKAGGAMVLVNAPIAVVRTVVTDYGKYASFIRRFKKSRVIARKDGKTDVYLEVPILHGAATVWAQARFEPPVKEGETGERIDAKMLDVTSTSATTGTRLSSFW